MEDFGFYKTIRLSKGKNLESSFSKLRNVYHDIPDTKGCMDNIDKEGGCGAWCCKIQSPQLLYAEFLLAWNEVSRTWVDDDVYDLLERCMLASVDTSPTRGCVFFDNKTKLCTIHKVRPYNCRIYGITPKEEFEPRYLRLKEEYKNVLGAVIRPQCDLISTCDGSEVTVEDTNKWWNKLNDIEHSIGIPRDMITDDMGGSYRTPHDHILLYNMPDNVLNGLAGIRNYDDEFEKIKAVKDLISVIRNVFKK